MPSAPAQVGRRVSPIDRSTKKNPLLSFLFLGFLSSFPSEEERPDGLLFYPEFFVLFLLFEIGSIDRNGFESGRGLLARANSSWKEVVCWPSLAALMFAPAVVMAPLVPSIVTQTAEFIDADIRWKAKEFRESFT